MIQTSRFETGSLGIESFFYAFFLSWKFSHISKFSVPPATSVHIYFIPVHLDASQTNFYKSRIGPDCESDKKLVVSTAGALLVLGSLSQASGEYEIIFDG